MDPLTGITNKSKGTAARKLAGNPRPLELLGMAIAGLQAALRQRKATPAEIARHAERGGVATVIRPCLEAFTADA